MALTDIRETGVRFALRSLDDETYAQWLDLWERVEAPAWVHPAWTRLWWNAFGAGRLALTCVRREGRLVAVAPTFLAGDELSAAANGHSPAWEILGEDDEAVRSAARAIFARRRRVSLFPLRDDEASAAALRRAAASAGYLTLERPLGVSPTIEFGAGRDHPGAISPRRRRDIRRRWRRIAEEGSLSFQLSDSPADLGPALDRCLDIEARGWKGETGTAIAASPETARFYRDLADWAGAHGWFKIAELRLNDQTMAFDFVLEAGGITHLIKTSFDPAYSQLSPGTLLRDAIVTRADALGFRRYELLGKLDGWKQEWTREGHPMVQLRAFPRTVDGAARRIAYGAAWAIRDRMNDEPEATNA